MVYIATKDIPVLFKNQWFILVKGDSFKIDYSIRGVYVLGWKGHTVTAHHKDLVDAYRINDPRLH